MDVGRAIRPRLVSDAFLRPEDAEGVLQPRLTSARGDFSPVELKEAVRALLPRVRARAIE